jgi:hypothetical protein
MTDHPPITEVVLTSDLFDDCIDVESLSPSALAVLDAYVKGFGWLDSPTKKDGRCIAATLRAAADQVVPSDADEPRNYLPIAIECQRIRAEILAIAAELEGSHD